MTVTAKYLPADIDIEYVQGDDVLLSFLIKGVDLSAGTGAAKARRTKNVNGTLIATYTVGLTASGSDTQVVVELASGSNTATGKGYWDLEITLSGATRTYIAGEVTITPHITD